MPYATENQISTQPINGGVEITEQQYKQALEAQLEGRAVAIRNGELRLLSAETKTVYSTADKSELNIPENDDTPEGYTDTAPSEYDTWNGSKWVEDTAARERVEWKRIRKRRDTLLTETDWAVLPDSPHDTQTMRDYRQALRDIPETYNNPDDIVWPENPLEG